MADRNLFGRLEDTLKTVGGGVGAFARSDLVNALSRLNPEVAAAQDARQFRREETRAAQAFTAKQNEFDRKARESLMQKKAKLKADEEERGREREAQAEQDAREDLLEGIKLAGSRAGTMGPAEAELLPGIPGLEPPVTIDAPGAGAEQIRSQVLQDILGAGGSEAFASREASALAPQEAATKFQIEQDENGEFILVPTRPGVDVARTGAFGETGRGKTDVTVNLPGSVTKTTRTRLEQGITNAQDGLAEIDVLLDKYQPVFNTALFQFGAKFENTLGRFPGVRNILDPAIDAIVPASTRKKFGDFYEVAFLIDSRMFEARKEITGVAGGPVEMERIESFLPNLDKDGPRRFMSKVRVQRLLLQKTIDHYIKLREQGITEQTVAERTNIVLQLAKEAQREVRNQERIDRVRRKEESGPLNSEERRELKGFF